MDQNNMSQQENTGAQPTEQVQNPYVQPTEQVQNPYVQPAEQVQNPYVQPAEQVQNPYMAPMNQQPAYQPPVVSDDVSMGEWMWTLFLACIPVVNLILLLVWAFDGSTKASKANFSKAMLLWMVICFCLVIILVIFGFIFGIVWFSDYLTAICVALR